MKDWYEGVKAPDFNRVLWVVGTSGTGKTTFAKAIANAEGIPLVEAGGWIRRMHGPDASPEELSATTTSILSKDARHFSRLIGEELAKHPRSVLAGARNPTDFVDNFDPKRDAVVFLRVPTLDPRSDFERVGVRAIRSYVDFLLECDIIPSWRVVIAEPST